MSPSFACQILALPWVALVLSLALAETVRAHGVVPGETEIFTTDGPSGSQDVRYLYDYRLLQMALEKTRKDFGAFILNVTPDLSNSRLIEEMRKNVIPNYVGSFGYNPSLDDKGLTPIPIPIFRGALGFRTCFMAEKVLPRFAAARDIVALRAFSHGAGVGWFDVDVLRFNGFNVYQVPNYDSLFKMVAINRFDVFCRGLNEVFEEYGRYRETADFRYDRSTLFYYPFPQFFYLHRDNARAIARIRAGLQRAYEDGSFHAFWSEQLGKGVAFAGLESRRVVVLENPALANLNLDFEQYYPPLFLKVLRENPRVH